MDFEGRVAIITGGAGSLGQAVATDLLASGARVAVPYVSEEHWTALQARAGASPDRLWGAQMDLAHAASVERLAAQVTELWGRIDFLLCLAGGFAPGKVHETSADGWDHMFDLNLRTVYLALHAVVPVMIKQNFGRIITTSSAAILAGGGAGIAAYGVAKAAVRHLTELLAEELKEYDIRAHCLMPGTMDTPANRLSMPAADFSEWVRMEDVVPIVHFLLSDAARAVRSVTVPVLG